MFKKLKTKHNFKLEDAITINMYDFKDYVDKNNSFEDSNDYVDKLFNSNSILLRSNKGTYYYFRLFQSYQSPIVPRCFRNQEYQREYIRFLQKPLCTLCNLKYEIERWLENYINIIFTSRLANIINVWNGIEQSFYRHGVPIKYATMTCFFCSVWVRKYDVIWDPSKKLLSWTDVKNVFWESDVSD